MKRFSFISLLLLLIVQADGFSETLEDKKTYLLVERSRYTIYHSQDKIAKQKALEVINQLADQNNGMALNALGLIYMKGKISEKDTLKACQYFTKASEQGVGDAMCNLAKLYRTGRGGIPKNKELAFKYYKMAADINHSIGVFWTGKCYYRGEGTEKNYDEAYKWFLQGEKQETLPAKFRRGVCLFKGRGVEKDREAGIKIIKECLNEGYSHAKVYLKYNKIEL
ncbi:sel1 repeat family protein [Halosquirtibacter laminarini]|uniref:Sel1 repeat family protein n=1 Tax=Halosquirtibacter laminarini TaxID=3374600 RepID=A0AC61NNR4_9BACT|nr:sel1 repeat family protein [Prolixibacteraceae bacterium]